MSSKFYPTHPFCQESFRYIFAQHLFFYKHGKYLNIVKYLISYWTVEYVDHVDHSRVFVVISLRIFLFIKIIRLFMYLPTIQTHSFQIVQITFYQRIKITFACLARLDALEEFFHFK